jgi:hypothetical protein
MPMDARLSTKGGAGITDASKSDRGPVAENRPSGLLWRVCGLLALLLFGLDLTTLLLRG